MKNNPGINIVQGKIPATEQKIFTVNILIAVNALCYERLTHYP